jgi:hypothetical protein
MQLKPCPKCGGVISLEKDRYGVRVYCRMCGWSKDLNPVPPPAKLYQYDEETVYVRDGCRVAQTCFECPLPDCQYEMRVSSATYLRDQRLIAAFQQHRQSGESVPKAAALTAKELGTSDRSIYRALARQRAA